MTSQLITHIHTYDPLRTHRLNLYKLEFQLWEESEQIFMSPDRGCQLRPFFMGNASILKQSTDSSFLLVTFVDRWQRSVADQPTSHAPADASLVCFIFRTGWKTADDISFIIYVKYRIADILHLLVKINYRVLGSVLWIVSLFEDRSCRIWGKCFWFKTSCAECSPTNSKVITDISIWYDLPKEFQFCLLCPSGFVLSWIRISNDILDHIWGIWCPFHVLI